MVKETQPETPDAVELDVYQQSHQALANLIGELCEALEVDNPAPFKRRGYEMIGQYFKEPVNTGELTLTLTTVLHDILDKLEMTQDSEHVQVVRDQYSMLKRDES